MAYGVKVLATGRYLPERVLTNFDLEKIVDTTDEWIRTRTGIETRHIAAEDEATSDMGTQAALRAMEEANVKPEEIDLILVATLSPDKIFPNTACFVQKKIGAVNASCFSIEAACSGFVFGFQIAASMIQTGLYKRALLIGAEMLSSVVNWDDRTTCVLFGDGAGAVVLAQCPESENCFVASDTGSNGEYTDILHVQSGGTADPLTVEKLQNKQNCLEMSGKEVFKIAVNSMVSSAKISLEQANLTIDDIDWIIPHQANLRIIAAVGDRLGINKDKCYINVHRYGNTSAASIPIALDELVRADKIKRGDHILFVAFGGGLTWGSTILKW
ncbi:MAG: ketoacyl-ACP synthase III [Lentisphaeria bacterium]|nr:ketoacyl-ACP synthase III [Lentisphaeria bacterium]NQZ70475.1 ketoacyl-ACP synthase III [Lentisphaeria bacterium]